MRSEELVYVLFRSAKQRKRGIGFQPVSELIGLAASLSRVLHCSFEPVCSDCIFGPETIPLVDA